MFMVHLLNAAMTDNYLPWDLGEKLTLIACMAFFLYYFMKELKVVRDQMEKKQAEYDKKYDALFERVIDMDRKHLEALAKVSDSNDRLADAVDGLKDQLSSKHN